MIEQARTSAITTRSHVILAIAEPGDLPNDDTRCRIGLFRVSEWPDDLQGEIPAKLIQRWRPLENGVVLAPGSDTQEAGATLENPLDSTQLQIRDETRSKPKQIEVHAIVFNPRGGMAFPEGSSPAELRIAEGTYRSGKAVPVRRGTPPTIAENRLKIGRIIARPYRSN
jgi:hypothetical protein